MSSKNNQYEFDESPVDWVPNPVEIVKDHLTRIMEDTVSEGYGYDE